MNKKSILHNNNFLLLITGNTTSLAGDIIFKISLSLYVLKLTGSAEQFAGVLAMGVLPIILLGSFAGSLVDRYFKKRVMVLLDCTRFLIQMSLLVLFMSGNLTLTSIYVAIFFSSVCEIFYGPASITILPLIVEGDDLVSANTIDGTTNRIIEVFSPLVGALIFSQFGIGIIFLINAGTFLFSAFTESFISVSEKCHRQKDSSLIQDTLQGFRIFQKDKRITSLVVNGILTHVFLFPFFMIGIPHFIINVFEAPEVYYGLVESTATLGAATIFFMVPYLKRKFDIDVNIGITLTAVFFISLPYMALGNTDFLMILRQYPYAPLCYFGTVSFFLFSALGAYLVFFRSFYQMTVPPDMLGRFGSLLMMLLCAGRLVGFKIYGYLFETDLILISVTFLGCGMFFKMLVHIPFLLEHKKRKSSCTGLPNSITF